MELLLDSIKLGVVGSFGATTYIYLWLRFAPW